MPTTLVYLTGALGDAILATPALQVVRAAYVESHLVGVLPPALCQLYPGICDTMVSTSTAHSAELFTDNAGAALSRLADGRPVDTVVLFESPESALASALQKVDGLDVVCIDSRPREGFQDHYAMALWWATCRRLACDVAFAAPRPQCAAPRQEPRTPYGVVHPGSGGKTKIAPPALIAEACAGRPRMEWILAAGEADEAAAAALARHMRVPYMIVRRPPLTELAWYLAHAAWYVGNDSGVSHLAGVLDTPGTVFFGPTDPAAWRPLGETIELVRFQGVRATRGQPETSAIADKEEPQ